MTSDTKSALDERSKTLAPQSGLVASTLHRLSMAAKISIAFALALTPLTAVLVLGWIVRLMRRESIVFYVRSTQGCHRRDALAYLDKVDTLKPYVRFPGWWSGLWQTVFSGLQALVVLAALTLPYGLLLLVSWWAGWENSFNKGYEQAWAGPSMALAGFVLAVLILSHLPMAFARFAAEGQIWSITEMHQIRRCIRLVRWQYLALSLITVLATVPLFLAQMGTTFIEKINPRVLTAGPDEIQEIANRWHLLTTAYLLFALFFLRRWAARLYARAILIEPELAGAATNGVLSEINATGRVEEKRLRRWIGMVFATLLGLLTWSGFLAMLYIAQFANHAWWNWVNHALVGIPWIFRPV